MPASEFEWNTLSHTPSFHNAFPTKRKATSEFCLENSLHQDIADEHMNKRRCQWTNGAVMQVQQQPQFFTEAVAVMQEVNHNDSHMNFNNNNSLTVAPAQAQSPVFQSLRAQSQPNRVPSPWPSDQSVQAHQNVYHPQYMDTAGCGSQTQMNGDETDAACMVMDSDCVPNPQQYSAEERHQHRQDSEYCKQYCGAGDESPISGRVRCYCKPSWEGMMDLKPYISDVY